MSEMADEVESGMVLEDATASPRVRRNVFVWGREDSGASVARVARKYGINTN
jgi:hypothetical protein